MVWAVLANLLLVGTAAAVTTFARGAPDQFYLLVQEDGVLEWCTFWTFFMAAGVGFAQAFRERTRWPWYVTGVAIFCLLVAMEEISWGQRLFAYRPPTYFLEHNFQQELNLHNVASTGLRKLALTAIIACYGIVLPLLLRIPSLHGLASRGRALGRAARTAPVVRNDPGALSLVPRTLHRRGRRAAARLLLSAHNASHEDRSDSDG